MEAFQTIFYNSLPVCILFSPGAWNEGCVFSLPKQALLEKIEKKSLFWPACMGYVFYTINGLAQQPRSALIKRGRVFDY